ncbi:MAG: hypothetical protein HY940_06430 [Gammaproteobacteria bacterium]|nr:hypothetical protein [Gammaproteobacteria bacterium]
MENFGSWSVLTTNFLFTLYLALGGVTFASVLHLSNGKWRFVVRKLAVSFAALFPIAGVLLLVLLANKTSTFPWTGTLPEHAAHLLTGWQNYTFLVVREIGGFIAVATLYGLFIKYQHLSEGGDAKHVRTFRNIALLIPFAYFIYGSMVAWDFEMTQVPGWHSASYGAYHFQSNFHMFLAFFTVFLFFMNRCGALAKDIEDYIFNYMAQFMLAMTILWTYLYFTQYLIMWYGRFPDEMARYNGMMHNGLGVLWWTFLTMKFIIPFCTLAITPNRHNPVIITMVAASIVLGTWIERYTWISGSILDERVYENGVAHLPMTSLFDIVVTIAVIGAGWWAVRYTLNRYGLSKQC